MNKITKYPIIIILLFSILATVQNTASLSGNWDACATWGSPTSILQNNTDTKTINTSVNVIQNTTWSTNTVDFGTGNGSVSFASSANFIDFMNDGGPDKSCCATAPVLTSVAVTSTNAPYVCATATYCSSNTSMNFVMAGSNMGTTTWAITPTSVTPATGTATGGTTSKTAGAINFSSTGTYTLKFTAAGTGSCITSNAELSKTVTIVCNDACDGILNNWTATGSVGVSEYHCGYRLNAGDCSPASGSMSRTFNTVVGRTYYYQFPILQQGTATSSGGFTVKDASGTNITSGTWAGVAVQQKTGSFVATSTTGKIDIFTTSGTCATANIIMSFTMYTIDN